eukprot:6361752-Amphidinium_carterae.1
MVLLCPLVFNDSDPEAQTDSDQLETKGGERNGDKPSNRPRHEHPPTRHSSLQEPTTQAVRVQSKHK